MAATPGYVSNTELASRISALVDRWDQREYQMIDLLTVESGNVTVTDGLGKDHLIPSYRSLLTSVSGMVDDLSGAVAQVSDLTNSARRFSESATASSGRAAASAARAEELANGVAGSVAAGKADINEHVAQANVGIAKSVSDAAASATAAASSEQAAASSAANAAGSSATAAVEANDASADAARAASSRNEALAYQNGADAAKAAALGAQAASEAARAEADLIANAPVGTVLPSGGYSAMHWAKQAQATATGTLVYLGGWDASKGTFPPEPRTGHFYKVLVAGDVEGVSFNPGDQMVYNGEGWDKIDNTDQVSTVNGKSGTVVLGASDIVGLGALATRSDVDFTTQVKGKPSFYPASPHGHAKAEVGLGNVDNTSDQDKPLSSAMRAALNAEEGARVSGDDALQRSLDALASDMAVVPFFTGKNRLINGNFDFYQRGNPGTLTNTAAYTADRWICSSAGAGVTSNWGLGATPLGEIPDSRMFLGFNVVAGVSSAWVGQYIERVNTFAGDKATVSFWMRSGVAGKKVGLMIQQHFGAGGSAVVEVVSPQVLTLTTTFTKYTATFDVPSIVGKSLGTNDALLLAFFYCDDRPTLFGGQLMGQTGLFEVAQVQMERGDKATDFDWRPFGQELALCQRYFCKTYDLGTKPGTPNSDNGRVAMGIQIAGTNSPSFTAYALRFPVNMRTTPVVTLYGAVSGNRNKITMSDNSDSSGSPTARGLNGGGCEINWSNNPGTFGGWFHYTADAEI